MKRGLESYPPLEITLYRIFIVFLVFTPIGIKDFFNFSESSSISFSEITRGGHKAMVSKMGLTMRPFF